MAWLTLTQFCRGYHLDYTTAKRLLTEPDFPAAQTSPHRWRIASEKLDDWLATWGERQRKEGPA